jgi:hypothetical protein
MAVISACWLYNNRRSAKHKAVRITFVFCATAKFKANISLKKSCYIVLVLNKGAAGNMTIGEINITNTLEEVDKFLKEEKISPQIRSMVKLLVVVIKLLVAKLGLNSKNSSIPPSKDPNRTRGSSRKVKGIKRKPGGQKGHNGTTLQQVDNPDKIEKLRINRKSLPRGEYKECGVERRQVIDIKISRQVTEYQAEILNSIIKFFVLAIPGSN